MDLDANIHVRELSGTVNNDEPREINIYQVPDVELIWKGTNDQNKQISFWKTQKISGYFSPGVIAVKGHEDPGIGFLLKANPRSAVAHFKLPESYDLVFKGSDVGLTGPPLCVWALKCPPLYVTVGMLTTVDCQEPSIGDAYCVLAEFTDKIKEWQPFWSKDNSKNQGFVQKAKPTADLFDIMSIGAFVNFDYKNLGKNSIKENPLEIYAIKRSEGFYWTEKPVISTKISEITYDLENMEKTADPVEMNTATLENYSHIPQTVTRTISYTEEKTFSFDMGASVESGLSVEVEVGFSIPTPIPARVIKRL